MILVCCLVIAYIIRLGGTQSAPRPCCVGYHITLLDRPLFTIRCFVYNQRKLLLCKLHDTQNNDIIVDIRSNIQFLKYFYDFVIIIK